jgi:hypothetical protein
VNRSIAVCENLPKSVQIEEQLKQVIYHQTEVPKKDVNLIALYYLREDLQQFNQSWRKERQTIHI